MLTSKAIRHQSSTTAATTPKKTLLLTLDAFETLFHPRDSVPKQYASAAHSFGISPTLITEERIKASFKDAYKAQVKRRPNYGRRDVLLGEYGGPKQWWDEIIRSALVRAMKEDNKEEDAAIPDALVESLIGRFSNSEGYKLYDDVVPFFDKMKRLKCNDESTPMRMFNRVLIGIISNSDDRIPAVLKSLGLTVGDVRADERRLLGFEGISKIDADHKAENDNNDIDLVITSYEAGEVKPSRVIFDIAKRQAHRLMVRGGENDIGEWVYVHVGDDDENDYGGAINAGWHSYLLLRGKDSDVDMSRVDANTIHSLMDLFPQLGKYASRQ